MKNVKDSKRRHRGTGLSYVEEKEWEGQMLQSQ